MLALSMLRTGVIKPVASEAICKWGGGRNFFDVPLPHFSLVPPPHMTGAQRLFVTD